MRRTKHRSIRRQRLIPPLSPNPASNPPALHTPHPSAAPHPNNFRAHQPHTPATPPPFSHRRLPHTHAPPLAPQTRPASAPRFHTAAPRAHPTASCSRGAAPRRAGARGPGPPDCAPVLPPRTLPSRTASAATPRTSVAHRARGGRSMGRGEGGSGGASAGGRASRGELPVLPSPSAVWARLTRAQRVAWLLGGFAVVYYVMFAKHHWYDREITAIHTEVEALIRQVNTSEWGRGEEAVLPDIFKGRVAADDQLAAGGGKEAEAKAEVDVDAGEKEAAREQHALRKEVRAPEELEQELKQEDEGREGREGREGGEAVAEQQRGRDTREGDDLSARAAMEVPRRSKLGSRVESKSEAELSSKLKPELDPASNPTPKPKAKKKKRSKAKQKPGSTMRTKHATLASKPVGSSATRRESKPLRNPNEIAYARRPRQGEPRGYAEEYRDSSTNNVPKDHIPILDWNYKELLNPDTTEQIFGIGKKMDHVASYKPLCIQAGTGTTFSFAGRHICGGFNRTTSWFMQYCDIMRESLLRETLLNMQPHASRNVWLEENQSAIQWVEGLTIFQILEKNCGNIAHFSGRALMLHHIIENIAAYAAPPSVIKNVLVLPTFHVMKRFWYPHNYGYWHKSLFSALIAPAQFTIGTLGNFVYREQNSSFNGTPHVQLLLNFSMTGEESPGKKYVCFRRAVVPGFLKGRFFVDDVEYPSSKPSLQSSAANAPRVPRDSLRLRERLRALFSPPANSSAPLKKVVFLDRSGSRRIFQAQQKAQILDLLRSECAEKGYEFHVVSFDQMDFQKQYETMESASIAVGIHGANIVNTMFMPPLSVLVELFPYGFHHDMYENGGNAGLKYFNYSMKTGLPFQATKPFRSVEQCIRFDRECKVHYRDSPLQVTAEDLSAMRTTLQKAIAWWDKLSKDRSAG